MSHAAISQTSRPLPDEWTDDLLIELFDHARYLGQHGNPGGYMVTVELFPFVGVVSMTDHETPRRYLKPRDQWDFAGMREWVKHNPELVRVTWQREVRSVW